MVQTRRSRTGIGMHFSRASVGSRVVPLADIRVFWARWYNTAIPARMEAIEVAKRMSRSVFIVRVRMASVIVGGQVRTCEKKGFATFEIEGVFFYCAPRLVKAWVIRV